MLKSEKKWVYVGTLDYPVKKGNKVVIPAGTKDVSIAFRQGNYEFVNKETGKKQRANLYKVNGIIY